MPRSSRRIRPMHSASSLEIARLEELAPGRPLARDIDTVDGPRHVIVLATDAGVRVWLNSCPHQGVRLDWQPGVLLDVTGEHLMCAMHGALFRPHDGLCLAGPCTGQALLPVACEVVDGVVRLAAGTTLPASARSGPVSDW